MADKFPEYRGEMEYFCLGCGGRHGVEKLLYTCPDCGSVLMLEDKGFARLKTKSGREWREIFDGRASSKVTALRGIFRFYELMAPVLDEEDILWLGEGNTPVVKAGKALRDEVGFAFAVKNEGQNPSASFKDRGMACAFSYLNHLIRAQGWDAVLTICASTGDTSAAAALYAAYLAGNSGADVKSVVLLPQGKVTPQQLGQPLGSGATVIELPGVFDDCMKVVERLAENYRVALLNSKNAWRILGQESYAFEVAQWQGWDVKDLAVFVPVGNAGNITAILNGFLKLLDLGVIETLPRIFGVQSSHADPVYRYYSGKFGDKFAPVKVRPSTAQAAMIGNPVSFPRVRRLAERYRALAGDNAFQVVQVPEQDIMDSMLQANRHGHTICTHGGECLAGLKAALGQGLLEGSKTAVLDSTAHILKFADFQQRYFEDAFSPEYEVTPKEALRNKPVKMLSGLEKDRMTESEYVAAAAGSVAGLLGLEPLEPGNVKMF